MLWEQARLTGSRRRVGKKERIFDMTGSMYAAVSGLKAHMNALNVIGNNVSNVNTTAYKATRYTFNEALYTMQRSGSDGTQIAGGRNPAQVGFGASIGTIDLDMSTKNYTPTGQMLDTMIDGDGFFFVGDKETGSGATAVEIGDQTTLAGMKLTRLGNFNIDPNGYLVDGNGSVVWGFLEEEVREPQKTGTGDDAAYAVTPGEENMNNGYVEVTDETTGEVTARYKVFDFQNGTTTEYKYLTQLTEEDVETLKKRKENPIELHNIEYETRTVTDDSTDPATEKQVRYVKRATMTQNAAMGSVRIPMYNETEKQVKWPVYSEATDAVRDEEGNITRPAELAKLSDDESDGNSRLQADSVTIDEKSGALRVMTSTGQMLTVGYLAVGKVTNPNGVTHVDGRYYQAQAGAGVLRVTSIGESVAGVETAGDTRLITGGLESSGTDLATEITNMITVQRGYQANTRIVTVTDSMLEELVNMKR